LHEIECVERVFRAVRKQPALGQDASTRLDTIWSGSMRPELESALGEVCAELSGSKVEVAWRPAKSTIEATRGARDPDRGDVLASCELERTEGGLVARQLELDAHGRRLQHGYSLLFAPERLWRRWTDGAELTDEDLAAELVSWTYRLAIERADANASS
jgi:hypothetical protein